MNYSALGQGCTEHQSTSGVTYFRKAFHRPETAFREAARGRAGEAEKAEAAATQAATMATCIRDHDVCQSKISDDPNGSGYEKLSAVLGNVTDSKCFEETSMMLTG